MQLSHQSPLTKYNEKGKLLITIMIMHCEPDTSSKWSEVHKSKEDIHIMNSNDGIQLGYYSD